MINICAYIYIYIYAYRLYTLMYIYIYIYILVYNWYICIEHMRARVKYAYIQRALPIYARARTHTYIYTYTLRDYTSCAQYMAPMLLEISINVLFYIYVCELGQIKNFFCNICIIFLYSVCICVYMRHMCITIIREMYKFRLHFVLLLLVI